MLVGLSLLAAGCSRPPAGRRPTAVYVSVDRLVSEHPQWNGVVALDRQIAYLKKYSVRQTSPVLVSSVRFPPRPATESTRNISTLETAIERRLDFVYERQKAALEARLARQHKETRAASVIADRNAIFATADAEMKRILDARGLKIRNLDIRLEAYDALMRAYVSQGWDTKNLAQERKKVADEVLSESNAAWAQMGEVLKGLQAKLGERTDEETAATLKWMRENSQAKTDLEREINRQKSLLLGALSDIGKPIKIDTTDGAQASTPAGNSSVAQPALPPPDLSRISASLAKRRAVLAEYLWRSTRAIVKSAAARRGLSVEFTPREGLPDKTADFRAAVRFSPVRLGGTR